MVTVLADGWAQHFFTRFQIDRETAPDATGEFNPGTSLAGAKAVQLFVATRILV